MEKRKRSKRTALVKLRVSEGELETIQRQLKQTTHRSLSEYLRKLALNKPVTVKIRNESADEFLRDMLQLRSALEGATGTYESAVAKLRAHSQPQEVRGWLLLHERDRQHLLQQVAQVHQRVTQLYEQWLQK